MITENLPSLKINKLTQEQYDAAKAAGNINENELYMTPDSSVIVTDIIDNLTTDSSDKPLSAAQGVELKALIDAITVPTKVSELENDSGFVKNTDLLIKNINWIFKDEDKIYSTVKFLPGAMQLLSRAGGNTSSITLSGGISIIGLNEPTSDTMPTTKKYVDDIVGNIESLLADL